MITYFNHISLYIAEKINGLSLITNSGKWDASKNSIKVQICQNNVCCKTSILPGKYEKGTRMEYSGSDLNNCENWPISNNKEIKAIVYHTNEDGWSGDIWLHSTFNSFRTCSVIWIQNENKEIQCIGNCLIDILTIKGLK